MDFNALLESAPRNMNIVDSLLKARAKDNNRANKKLRRDANV